MVAAYYAACSRSHAPDGSTWSSTNGNLAVIQNAAEDHDNTLHNKNRTAKLFEITTVPDDNNDKAQKRLAYETAVTTELNALAALKGMPRQSAAELAAVQSGIDTIRIAHFGS